MLICAFLLAALRFSADHVVHTYHNETTNCRALLQKAKDADIESVRNAYCVEVVEADQLAVRNTLGAFGLGSLQSNETYSTFEEVLQYSCKVPQILDTLLRWTAGFVPMTCAWVLLTVYQEIRKSAPQAPLEPPETQAPLETPPSSPDKPPLCPSKPPRQRKYVRELYKAVETLDPPDSRKTAFEIVQNISPSVRKRMMRQDV
jgi:hypothetical protein